MKEIGAPPLGICAFCRQPLFATTTHCPSRGFSGGRPVPRLIGAPPCPVEDGTLAAETLKFPFPPRGNSRPTAAQTEKTMTKNELISAIADDTGKPKTDVASILASLGRAVEGSLKAKADILIPGVGKLKPDARAARTARNPSTGAMINVPAKTVVKFKVVKELADAVA